jgi:hypothetical protein
MTDKDFKILSIFRKIHLDALKEKHVIEGYDLDVIQNLWDQLTPEAESWLYTRQGSAYALPYSFEEAGIKPKNNRVRFSGGINKGRLSAASIDFGGEKGGGYANPAEVAGIIKSINQMNDPENRALLNSWGVSNEFIDEQIKAAEQGIKDNEIPVTHEPISVNLPLSATVHFGDDTHVTAFADVGINSRGEVSVGKNKPVGLNVNHKFNFPSFRRKKSGMELAQDMMTPRKKKSRLNLEFLPKPTSQISFSNPPQLPSGNDAVKPKPNLNLGGFSDSVTTDTFGTQRIFSPRSSSGGVNFFPQGTFAQKGSESLPTYFEQYPDWASSPSSQAIERRYAGRGHEAFESSQDWLNNAMNHPSEIDLVLRSLSMNKAIAIVHKARKIGFKNLSPQELEVVASAASYMDANDARERWDEDVAQANGWKGHKERKEKYLSAWSEGKHPAFRDYIEDELNKALGDRRFNNVRTEENFYKGWGKPEYIQNHYNKFQQDKIDEFKNAFLGYWTEGTHPEFRQHLQEVLDRETPQHFDNLESAYDFFKGWGKPEYIENHYNHFENIKRQQSEDAIESMLRGLTDDDEFKEYLKSQLLKDNLYFDNPSDAEGWGKEFVDNGSLAKWKENFTNLKDQQRREEEEEARLEEEERLRNRVIRPPQVHRYARNLDEQRLEDENNNSTSIPNINATSNSSVNGSDVDVERNEREAAGVGRSYWNPLSFIYNVPSYFRRGNKNISDVDTNRLGAEINESSVPQFTMPPTRNRSVVDDADTIRMENELNKTTNIIPAFTMPYHRPENKIVDEPNDTLETKLTKARMRLIQEASRKNPRRENVLRRNKWSDFWQRDLINIQRGKMGA